MADELPESLLYEGVSIDVLFAEPRPSFGDLLGICETPDPEQFPPTAGPDFQRLSNLQFSQVDDYFGVQAVTDEGDDTPIWLYPLVKGRDVYHHPGPFDGVRLSYNVLRNPSQRAEHFYRCVQEFAAFASSVVYRSRRVSLGLPPDLGPVQRDVAAIEQHWANEGIVVGSSEALEQDF